jgi:hypothetical protein
MIPFWKLWPLLIWVPLLTLSHSWAFRLGLNSPPVVRTVLGGQLWNR